MSTSSSLPLTATATPMVSLCFSTRPLSALPQASQIFLTWGESSASLRLELVFLAPRRARAIAFCEATCSQTAAWPPPPASPFLEAARTFLSARIVLLVLPKAAPPRQRDCSMQNDGTGILPLRGGTTR